MSVHLTRPEDLSLAVGADVAAEAFALLTQPPPELADRMFRLDGDPGEPPHVLEALGQIQKTRGVPPYGLLPLLYLDEASYACLVCAGSNVLPTGAVAGAVVRCFVTPVPRRFLLSLLDTSLRDFVASFGADLRYRSEGLNRLDRETARYHNRFVKQGETPRPTDLRPIRLACQNVVVAVGAFQHDRRTDALNAPMWQTCEVPHVATHEGARALSVLMLCDAFKSGGTMEIRFDDHVERVVPQSLRRLGRVLGIDLGAEDPRRISPEESRALMQAVTPMPAKTRERMTDFCAWSGTSPERLCFLILSGVWSCIELDYLVWSAPEVAASIVAGGSSPVARIAHGRELTAGRAAQLLDLLHRRLVNATGQRAHDAVEDLRIDITWSLDGQSALLARSDGLPLSAPGIDLRAEEQIRVTPTPGDLLHPPPPGSHALVPQDDPSPPGVMDPIYLPVTRRVLDRATQRRLVEAQVGRR